MSQSQTSHQIRTATPKPDEQLELQLGRYRAMQLIRRFEEEAARAYAQGKIGGFLHLYIGQEAIAVGTVEALRSDDYVLTTYRDHGLALARGMSARSAMAELYGKATGCSRGLGGSMHFFDVEHHMLGGYGIIGGHLPIAAGTAFASKYRGEDRVTVVFFGDGAASIGDCHEAMALAALWKLPVVFVCENNEYSMGTPLSRTLAVEDVTARAPGYGMPSDRFRVESVAQVVERISVAIERARRGEGPSLLEMRTYRFRGHSMSDPGKYRTAEEVEERKRQDPLLRLRDELASRGQTSALEGVDQSVEDEVQDALRFADESPEPDASILEATTYKGACAG